MDYSVAQINPYQPEIDHFDKLISENDPHLVQSLNVPKEPHLYKSLEETSLLIVDTEEKLDLMI